MTRETFAKTIDESPSSLQNYEEGQYKREHTIPLDILFKISEAHHINICWLIEGRPHKKQK